MSADRRKKRMINAQGKELYNLTVEYLFHIQNKSLKETNKLLKEYNLKWVNKCRTFKRDVVDPDPHGFREFITKKIVINGIREKLGLDKPDLNWIQRLFYFR